MHVLSADLDRPDVNALLTDSGVISRHRRMRNLFLWARGVRLPFTNECCGLTSTFMFVFLLSLFLIRVHLSV